MKLIVDRARDPEYTPAPDTGSRPALRILQGGLARPSRLAPPPAPRDSQAEPTELVLPSVDLDDVPIYLRPIPAWVPRLW